MNIISVCVLGLFAVLGSLTLKNYNKEISALLIISAVILMCLTSLPVLSELFSSINEFSTAANIQNEYISVLIKSLGICYITQLSVNICKENGSQSIASQIEIAGKLMILILAIPIYNDLITMISDFLQ